MKITCNAYSISRHNRRNFDWLHKSPIEVQGYPHPSFQVWWMRPLFWNKIKLRCLCLLSKDRDQAIVWTIHPKASSSRVKTFSYILAGRPSQNSNYKPRITALSRSSNRDLKTKHSRDPVTMWLGKRKWTAAIDALLSRTLSIKCYKLTQLRT